MSLSNKNYLVILTVTAYILKTCFVFLAVCWSIWTSLSGLNNTDIKDQQFFKSTIHNVNIFDPGGGGGGGAIPYVCISGMCRARDPHLLHSEAYHFHKWQTNIPLRSITIYIFAVPETTIFNIYLRSSRSSPPTASVLQPVRTQSVRAAPRGYSRSEFQLDASYSQFRRHHAL